jgi:serine/threonine-protein kinase RsbW
MEERVEISIPNILGSEKVAVERAAALAEEIGFTYDRVQYLKTAVAEACINAIEHGNKFDQNTKVGVTLTVNHTALQVTVHDHGNGIIPENIPKELTDHEGFPQRRGYGVFLISNLVNEFSFANKPGGGSAVTMVVYLGK